MSKKTPKTLTPKRRFPEFQDGAGWSSESFESLYDFQPTNSLSRNDLNYESGEVKNIHYGDIHTKFQALFDVSSESVPFINQSVDLTNVKPEGFCRERDMVFADASEDLDDVGKCIELVKLRGEKVLSGTHTILARPKSPTPVSGFGGHLFRSEQIRKQIRKEGQGAKVAGISPTRLGTIEVCYPPDEDEQQKIADCLGSLDNWIAAAGRKLAALRDHKRGLMQQLFPQPGQSQPQQCFPEFRNQPGWAKKKAGELFTERKAKGETGLPLYSVTIDDGMVLRSSFDRNFYDIEEAAKNKKVFKGDIAYNMMRMWQGACGVAPVDCMVSPAYVVLKPKKGVHSEFFFTWFKLYGSLQLLTAYSRGLTKDRLRLYFEDFSSIPMIVPEEKEQQKIATCLTALDTQITAQAAQLDTLHQHKRGLMQQLFPAPPEGGS